GAAGLGRRHPAGPREAHPAGARASRPRGIAMSADTFGGMRPLTDVIPIDEARARLAAAVRPVDRVETVPLRDAAGRVLAEDVTAPFDVPGFARAAMDGYAVRAADLARATADAPVTLRLAGESRPG